MNRFSSLIAENDANTLLYHKMDEGFMSLVDFRPKTGTEGFRP